MSLTIMEVLQNANHNLNKGVTPLQTMIGKAQIKNAVEALENGASLDDVYEEKEYEPEYKTKKRE